MKDVAISVIVPVYNVEKYICDCMDSIQAQTFKDFEVIVVNDKTEDKSFDIVKEKYGDMENLVLVENEQNMGLGEARNAGMKKARGKYIYFVDSDDVILPRCLETLYNVAEEKQADIVHMGSHYRPDSADFYYDEPNMPAKLWRDVLYSENIEKLPVDTAKRVHDSYATEHRMDMVWLNLYRREFLEERGLSFLPIIHEDNVFSLACYIATDRIWCIPTPLYLYRQRKDSITHDESFGRLTKTIEALILGLRFLEDFVPRTSSEISTTSAQLAYHNNMMKKIYHFFVETEAGKRGELVQAIDVAARKFLSDDPFLVCNLMYFMGVNVVNESKKR